MKQTEIALSLSAAFDGPTSYRGPDGRVVYGKGGGLSAVIGIVAAVAAPFAIPAISSAMGMSGVVGTAVAGAMYGAGTAALAGGNPLQGALLGGVGGALGGMSAGPVEGASAFQTNLGNSGFNMGGGQSLGANVSGMGASSIAGGATATGLPMMSSETLLPSTIGTDFGQLGSGTAGMTPSTLSSIGAGPAGSFSGLDAPMAGVPGGTTSLGQYGGISPSMSDVPGGTPTNYINQGSSSSQPTYFDKAAGLVKSGLSTGMPTDNSLGSTALRGGIQAGLQQLLAPKNPVDLNAAADMAKAGMAFDQNAYATRNAGLSTNAAAAYANASQPNDFYINNAVNTTRNTNASQMDEARKRMLASGASQDSVDAELNRMAVSGAAGEGTAAAAGLKDANAIKNQWMNTSDAAYSGMTGLPTNWAAATGSLYDTAQKGINQAGYGANQITGIVGGSGGGSPNNNPQSDGIWSSAKTKPTYGTQNGAGTQQQ